MERKVYTWQQGGIHHIHVATGYRTYQIKALGFRTSFNTRFAETNMVETLFCAINSLKQSYKEKDVLIIAYGDIMYQPENLKALLDCNYEIALMIDKKCEEH